MSDEHKQYASTSAATLEAHILSVHSAKSEAEWWAQREIERLRTENEKLHGLLREAWVKMDANNLWSNLRARVAAALKETGDE